MPPSVAARMLEKGSGGSSHAYRLQDDTIRMGIRNFLDRRIKENAIENIYQQLASPHAQAGFLLQVKKYELEYKRLEMEGKRLELEMERTQLSRMTDDQLEQLYNRIRDSHQQRTIPITISAGKL